MRHTVQVPHDPGTHVVTTCEECGERFEITHAPEPAAEALAHRQAKWLTQQFTWDHIQETRHRGTILLPPL
jgi:Fe2+ or Zn2+ uptake regulation protein